MARIRRAITQIKAMAICYQNAIKIRKDMKNTFLQITAACLAAMTVMTSSATAETNDSEGVWDAEFTLEYEEITYDGKEHKPEISAVIGDVELVEDVDFTVEFPEDCTSAGEKKIIIHGADNEEKELLYTIKPLDITKAEGISVNVPSCVYNGAAQCPKVAVMFGEKLLMEDKDFTVAYSNNINATVSDKAKCVITFRGNYTSTHTVLFDIAKAHSEDREIIIKANRGKNTIFNLSALKPSGASFGTPIYDYMDFESTNKPKIAFNELKFALNSNMEGSTSIRVPVKNQRNYEDYELIFTVESPGLVDGVELGVPILVTRKISKKYDGNPISVDVFAENGSYAELDGQRIEGTWSFIDEPPSLPCDAAIQVLFTPDDPLLETAYGVAEVSISKLRAGELSVSASPSHAEIGESVSVKISGIPDDYSGEIRLKSSGDGAEGFSMTRTSDTEYTVKFPEADALYTFTAELVGNEIYAANTAEFTVRVGNANLPEEETPARVTTNEELAEMVESAEEGAEITAEGCKSVPTEIVEAAAQKHLILRVKLNDTYTWVIESDKLSRVGELNLALTPAVIPYVLRERIGGDTSASFTMGANNLGNGGTLEVTVGEYNDGIQRFANLFLYNTDGELEFVSCNRADKSNGSPSQFTAKLKISKRGKYVVLTDTETKMLGDLNNDMRINVKDATEVLKIVVGITEEKNMKGDVDGNGKINVKDATQILKYVVGLPSTLGNYIK